MTISTISSNPIANTNTNHTYGLSGSGIDVDSMVKKLMTAATIPYTQMWQKEQQAEWKKAEYNTFYNSINTFNTSTVFNYTMQSMTLPQIASSSSTAVATATANADAGDINHSLTVNTLATGVVETSSGNITTGSDKNTLADQFGLAAGTTLNIQISDGTTSKTISVNTSTDSINSLVSDINSSGLNIKANYDATLDRFFLNTTQTGSKAKIDFSANGSGSNEANFLTNNLKLSLGGASASTLANQFGLSGSFTLNVTNNTSMKTGTVSINTATDSLQTFLNKLNAAGVNAVASYDPVADKVNITTSDGSDLTFAEAPGSNGGMNFLTNKLLLPASTTLGSSSSSNVINVPKLMSSGHDAAINLDGTDLTESSNNFTISGVTYNLASTGSTTVSVAADVNTIVSNVQSFVNAYNTMLTSLNTEVSQPVYSNYLPLTDDQKSQMKDSDITAWTTKAKSGLLHNDSILQDAINNMRNNISDPISGLTGTYNSTASIGITTGDYTENGILHLDTDKLKAALQADPAIVNKIFGTTGSSGNTNSQGIAVRLNNSLNNTVSQIQTVAGITPDTTTDTSSNLAIQIKDYTSRLTAMSTQLQDLQTRYYNEFDAMESALQQLNSQSSFISSLTSSSK